MKLIPGEGLKLTVGAGSVLGPLGTTPRMKLIPGEGLKRITAKMTSSADTNPRMKLIPGEGLKRCLLVVGTSVLNRPE